MSGDIKHVYEVLKNFVNINNSIIIEPGDIIRTTSPTNTFYAEAKVNYQFPKEATIFDLSQFLAAISIFKDPVVDWQEQCLIVSEKDKSSKITIRYHNKEKLNVVKQRLEFIPTDIEAHISKEGFSHIIKAIAVMKVQKLAFVGDEKTLTVVGSDPSNNKQELFSAVVGTTAKKFKAIIDVEKLKFIAAAYKISITEGVIKFETEDSSILYAMPLDADSEL